MRIFFKATVLVAFFISIPTHLTSGSARSQDYFQSLWIVRTSMTSQEKIQKAMMFAKENHFNHVFVQVRGRDDAFYKSDIVSRPESISNTSFDPLDFAIREGHSLGLEVHAWMNVYILGSANSVSTKSNSTIKQHPEWVDVWRNGDSQRELQEENKNLLFLSPAIPEVENYLLDVVEEVVTKYDLDGLHLDYVRYGDIDYGYNPVALEIFQNRTHSYSTKVTGRKFTEFRSNSITNFVRRCNRMVLRRNPDCLVSVAVKPNLPLAKTRYFQAWDQWLIEGLVDFVVMMNYASGLDDFQRNINLVMNEIPEKYLSGIIMGIALYNQDEDQIMEKIERCNQLNGISGISMFSYNVIDENPGKFERMLSKISGVWD
tara:strand:- start:18694 stop:19812 length:1119 start_codon:yes stop_codon:yes gene_type:complete